MLARQFSLLLSIAFATVLILAIWLTVQSRRFSADGERLTRHLEQTFTLNEDLHKGIVEQTLLLHYQFVWPDPQFLERFSQANFELAEKETQYLRLNLSEQELLTVARIRTLHSEFGIQATQIQQLLRSGKREAARSRMPRIEELKGQIESEFNALNALQAVNLKELLQSMNS
ncbi:MAG: hypothetical protein ACR2L2_12945 [Acidobacteriota bacterium]